MSLRATCDNGQVEAARPAFPCPGRDQYHGPRHLESLGRRKETITVILRSSHGRVMHSTLHSNVRHFFFSFGLEPCTRMHLHYFTGGNSNPSIPFIRGRLSWWFIFTQQEDWNRGDYRQQAGPPTDSPRSLSFFESLPIFLSLRVPMNSYIIIF